MRIFCVALWAVFMVSCSPTNKVSTQSYVGKEFVTESGLKYKIHKAGKGERAVAGSMVQVHYAGRLTDSTEFDNSFKRGAPITFGLGDGRVIKGWEEGIALLNVGDSATFYIPAKLGYGEKSVGPIPANSDLIFDVVLVSILPSAKPFNVSKKDTVVVAEGLKMIKIVSNAKGKVPSAGDQVKVHYSGYFKDGKKFDSSVDRAEPITFPIGQGRVIKGWDVGIMQAMKTGEKARLIISPEMAYGEKGYDIIPGNATLIFDIELIEVMETAKPMDGTGMDTIELQPGLKLIKFVSKPESKQALTGSTVKVHYSGFFENGNKFDSSVDRNDPFEFTLGTGQVIQGWDIAIASLRVGEKAKLIISPELAYGPNDNGPIPGNSTLYFDVELISVQ